jgi:hypothetical protein
MTLSGFLGFLVLALIIFFSSHREGGEPGAEHRRAMLLDAANSTTSSITELM